MQILTREFMKKALKFYGYILIFLAGVLVLRVALSGSFETFSPGRFLSLMLQPLNIYAWAFVTVMYFVFVAVIAVLLKNSGKKN